MITKAVTLSTLTICGTLITLMPWFFMMYLVHLKTNIQVFFPNGILFLILGSLVSTIIGGGILLFAIILISNIKDNIR